MAIAGELAEAGMRSTVTLRNKLNAQSEFTWQPIVGLLLLIVMIFLIR